MDAFRLLEVAAFLDIVEILKEVDPFAKRFRSVDLLDLTLYLGRVFVGRNAVQLKADRLFAFLLVKDFASCWNPGQSFTPRLAVRWF